MASLSTYAAIRAEARRRRKALLESAAKDFAEGREPNLAELRKQLDALDGLAELRSFPEWVLSASIPLTLALLVLLPLWWIRQPAPAIELSARASRVVLKLDAPAELDLGRLPPVKSMRVEGLASVSSDVEGVRFTGKDGRGSWYVEGPAHVSHIALRPLPGGPGAGPVQLVVARKGDAGVIAIEGMTLHMSASVERAGSAVWTDGRVVRKAALRDASLELKGASSAPAITKAYFVLGKDSAHLPVLRPRALAFREAAFDASGRPLGLPSVLEGQLVIAGSGRKHVLARDAELVLDRLEGNLLISLEADALRVSYAGRAGVVGLGNEATIVRDLRPTVAEWISRDSVLPLAWSGFVFLAGLGWTVRRFVRKPASS